MDKLLPDYTAKPQRIPVCFLRIEAGDGREGGGRNLKMNLQPRAKQPGPGEGRERGRHAHKHACMHATHAHRQAWWGLSAAFPGVSHGSGSLPNCLAEAGVAGGAAHARSRQLGTPPGGGSVSLSCLVFPSRWR